jgi:hypothetical protein
MSTTSRCQHIIRLINAQDLDLFWLEGSLVDQVKYPAGCAYNDVNTLLQLPNITTRIFSSNAHVGFNVHVLPNLEDDSLDLLSQLASWRKDKRLGL